MFIIALASISLNWRSGLLFVAAVILAILFFMGSRSNPPAWNFEVLAWCLIAAALCLWAAGIN